MIKYYVSPMAIGKDPNDCTAKTVPYSVIDKNALIELCCQDSSLSRNAVEAVFSCLEEVIPRELKNGNSIKTPLVSFSSSVAGVFKSQTDLFDKKRHRLKFNALPGTLIKKVIGSCHLTKVINRKHFVHIQGIKDHSINCVDRKIMAGSVVSVFGLRLKFNPLDQNQGIFLIDEKKQEIRGEIYIKNNNRSIIFQVPNQLAEGNYQLQIRCIPNNMKKLVIQTYDKIITVENKALKESF